LDTNIIFNYSNYTDYSNKTIEKCYLFIKNKSGNFILCYAVLKELEEIIKKRARIHKAVIEKIRDNSYLFENSPLLSFRDIPKAKQLFEKFKSTPINKVEDRFDEDRKISEIKIDKFIQFCVDERAISIEEININLVNIIHNYIENHADCKILSSAIQLQKDRPIFLFVTADGTDFSPNGYDYIKEHFEINYSKENWIFPELVNLMF
jgi:hypothetical protein